MVRQDHITQDDEAQDLSLYNEGMWPSTWAIERADYWLSLTPAPPPEDDEERVGWEVELEEEEAQNDTGDQDDQGAAPAALV